MKLGNIMNISNFMELLPSTQSPSQDENYANISKNPLKNKNWTFPEVHYFTWKLEFVSNILNEWMIVPWSNKKIRDSLTFMQSY